LNTNDKYYEFKLQVVVLKTKVVPQTENTSKKETWYSPIPKQRTEYYFHAT